MDSIQNIYFINMDSSLDRRKRIEEQMYKFNKPFTRIPAVIGKSLTSTQLDTHCSPFAKNFFTKSGIGCFLSHKRVWKRMVKNDEKYALVLEDDCELIEDCENVLDNTLKELFSFDPDWDFLYCGYTGVYDNKNMTMLDYAMTMFETPFPKKVDTSNLNYIFIPYCPLGTHCYVISLKCAKYLLDRFEKIEHQVDIAIRKCTDLRIYGSKIKIGNQSMEDSVIRDSVFPVTLNSVFKNIKDRNDISYDTLLNYPIYEIKNFQLSYYFICFILVTMVYPGSLYFCSSILLADFVIEPKNYNLIIQWFIYLLIVYSIRVNLIMN